MDVRAASVLCEKEKSAKRQKVLEGEWLDEASRSARARAIRDAFSIENTWLDDDDDDVHRCED